MHVNFELAFPVDGKLPQKYYTLSEFYQKDVK